MLQLSLLPIWEEHEESWFWFLLHSGMLKLIGKLKGVCENVWVGNFLYCIFSFYWYSSLKFELPCFILQAAVYFLLAIGSLISFIAFGVTRRNCFLYLALTFIVSIGAYLGFYRTRIRKKFNIKVGVFCNCLQRPGYEVIGFYRLRVIDS